MLLHDGESWCARGKRDVLLPTKTLYAAKAGDEARNEQILSRLRKDITAAASSRFIHLSETPGLLLPPSGYS